MSKNFIESDALRLKGQGIGHLAAIENLVNNAVGIADHTTHVDDIMAHARKAAECDEAVKVLQRYFMARPPQPQRPTMPPPGPGGPVRPAQSPTMRKAMAVQAPKPPTKEG